MSIKPITTRLYANLKFVLSALLVILHTNVRTPITTFVNGILNGIGILTFTFTFSHYLLDLTDNSHPKYDLYQ